MTRYPTFGFDDDETQLQRVPFHATTAEEFAAGLVSIRSDERKNAKKRYRCLLTHWICRSIPANFDKTVSDAARGIQTSEQLALAQHVVRRKLALELLEKLIKRLRARKNKDDDHYLENSALLYLSDGHTWRRDTAEVKNRAHELWIVDERLAFAREHSLPTSASTRSWPMVDRLIDRTFWSGIWHMVWVSPRHDSVDTSEPLRTMMIVEFKRPGRKDYKEADDQIESADT